MKILGFLIILAGVAFGIYFGIYFMLFCGIMQIVENINPLNAKEIAIGVLRVMFFEIGFIPVSLGSTIGLYLMERI